MEKSMKIATLLGGAAASLLIASSATAQDPVVRTSAGPVRGTDEDGVHVFKGVRYGADTASVRFQPARAPEPWRETVDAKAYGNTCPQITSGDVPLFASWVNDTPQSEDCLFLNVWTRGLADGKKRPVMVWFHGGGYVTGSGSSHGYDGVRLAKRGDVVLVTVNHRLNAFGYLNVAGLTDDPRYAKSGNVGSLDMVQSLQWVRDNIAKFGGDPDNVTIFGESGGGAKVSTMMAFPPAKGLFHKVIAQSGSMSLKGFSPAIGTAIAADIMRVAGLQRGEVDKLAAMPFEQLVAVEAKSKSRGAFFRPVTDGTVMPRDPFDPDAPAISRDVPLLVGTNQTETRLNIGVGDPTTFTMTWEELPERLGKTLPGTDVAALTAEQRRLHPGDNAGDIFFRVNTWSNYRKTAITQAERKAAQGGAPVYMYQLQWKTPVDGGKWQTPHALDIAFVFDNVDKSRSMVGTGGDQQHMADLMSDAWIAFARTGSPQTKALPTWPTYDATRRATMIFDSKPRVENDPEAKDRALFAGLPAGREG